MTCTLETETGDFRITIEEDGDRSFLVTRRQGPAGEALISAITPEQVVRMVLNREYRTGIKQEEPNKPSAPAGRVS